MLAKSNFILYNENIKSSVHKVEPQDYIYVLHEDAPILLADRVGIFIIS